MPVYVPFKGRNSWQEQFKLIIYSSDLYANRNSARNILKKQSSFPVGFLSFFVFKKMDRLNLATTILEYQYCSQIYIYLQYLINKKAKKNPHKNHSELEPLTQRGFKIAQGMNKGKTCS